MSRRSSAARGFTAFAMVVLGSLDALAQAADGVQPLTVADAIATTRAMGNPAAASRAEGFTFESPDRTRYAVGLVRGDMNENGVWAEILGGSLTSLTGATRPRSLARLFTKGLGSTYWYGNSALTVSAFNTLTWLDDRTLGLLWESPDADRTNQVLSLDVETGETRFLTQGKTHVTRFDVGPDGLIVFSAQAEHSPEQSLAARRSGFVVTAPDVFNVLNGDLDGHGMFDRYWNLERAIVRSGDTVSRRISVDGHTVQRAPAGNAVSFSKDGRYALIDWTPRQIPTEWQRYDHNVFQLKLREARADPLVPQLGARGVWQLHVLDLARANARPLWNAPMWPGVQTAWSPDSRSVVVGSTFVPIDAADADGLKGRALAVIAIDSGSFTVIPLPPGVRSALVERLAWPKADLIEVTLGGRMMRFRKDHRSWSECHAECAETQRPAAGRIRIELRQDLNTPPVFVAVDPQSRRQRTVLELNPRLTKRFSLGHVTSLKWKDDAGLEWNGLLFYPVHYSAGRRYPLVIQTHGYASPSEFSLYGTDGPGLGPGTSVYAAQPLANRDIAVLQVEDKDLPGVILTPNEPRVHMQGYEAAVRYLSNMGLIDTLKVGVVGFSRTGWHVGYALTHSEFPYAAAIISDNYDGNYVQATLSWNDENSDNMGATPFGVGLQQWVSMAPAFNAERVRTPLRLQIESGGTTAILTQWEMFTRLRQLRKPVELFAIPDIEHGSHGLQNPAQCFAAQQGAVDWFDFWLNGREDPAREKNDQYVRWRTLRDLRETPAHLTEQP